MSRFHRYSWDNILLIYSQRPEATHVAGFHAWLTEGEPLPEFATVTGDPQSYTERLSSSSLSDHLESPIPFQAGPVVERATGAI
jgi:hypothetical protein